MPRKIQAPEGGYQRLPSLRPEDLGGNDFAVCSITEVQDNIKVSTPGGGSKLSMRLRLAEFPERNYWPNATSQENLRKRLGRDVRGWKGAACVLEVVEVEGPDGVVLSVWVAEPKEWAKLIAAYKAQASGETPAPAPAPAPAPSDKY